MSGTTKKKKFLGSITACLAICIAVLLFVWHQPGNDVGQTETISKTVHYRFLIRNTTNLPVSHAVFFAHAPMKKTATQRCLSIETSHPHEMIADKSGRQIIKFSFENFPPYASKTISIRATLSLSSRPIKTSETDILRYSAALPESDSQAALIRELTTQFKSKDVKATASNIHNWVADNIKYTGYLSKAKGAGRTFVDRQGDCTEFADLFVALARAAGIPARRISGYLARGSRLLKPEAFHDWAEFYDNGIWRIADPQRKNFDTQYTNYIAMQIDDPAPPVGPMNGYCRFYVVGKGLKAKMDS